MSVPAWLFISLDCLACDSTTVSVTARNTPFEGMGGSELSALKHATLRQEAMFLLFSYVKNAYHKAFFPQLKEWSGEEL